MRFSIQRFILRVYAIYRYILWVFDSTNIYQIFLNKRESSGQLQFIYFDSSSPCDYLTMLAIRENRNFELNKLKAIKNKLKHIMPVFTMKNNGTCFIFSCNIVMFEKYLSQTITYYSSTNSEITKCFDINNACHEVKINITNNFFHINLTFYKTKNKLMAQGSSPSVRWWIEDYFMSSLQHLATVGGDVVLNDSLTNLTGGLRAPIDGTSNKLAPPSCDVLHNTLTSQICEDVGDGALGVDAVEDSRRVCDVDVDFDVDETSVKTADGFYVDDEVFIRVGVPFSEKDDNAHVGEEFAHLTGRCDDGVCVDEVVNDDGVGVDGDTIVGDGVVDDVVNDDGVGDDGDRIISDGGHSLMDDAARTEIGACLHAGEGEDCQGIDTHVSASEDTLSDVLASVDVGESSDVISKLHSMLLFQQEQIKLILDNQERQCKQLLWLQKCLPNQQSFLPPLNQQSMQPERPNQQPRYRRMSHQLTPHQRPSPQQSPHRKSTNLNRETYRHPPHHEPPCQLHPHGEPPHRQPSHQEPSNLQPTRRGPRHSSPQRLQPPRWLPPRQEPPHRVPPQRQSPNKGHLKRQPMRQEPQRRQKQHLEPPHRFHLSQDPLNRQPSHQEPPNWQTPHRQPPHQLPLHPQPPHREHRHSQPLKRQPSQQRPLHQVPHYQHPPHHDPSHRQSMHRGPLHQQHPHRQPPHQGAPYQRPPHIEPLHRQPPHHEHTHRRTSQLEPPHLMAPHQRNLNQHQPHHGPPHQQPSLLEPPYRHLPPQQIPRYQPLHQCSPHRRLPRQRHLHQQLSRQQQPFQGLMNQRQNYIHQQSQQRSIHQRHMQGQCQAVILKLEASKDCLFFPHKAPSATVCRVLHDDKKIDMGDIHDIRYNRKEKWVTVLIVPRKPNSLTTIENLRKEGRCVTSHTQCSWVISECGLKFL